jgi:hypothetical protein
LEPDYNAVIGLATVVLDDHDGLNEDVLLGVFLGLGAELVNPGGNQARLATNLLVMTIPDLQAKQVQGNAECPYRANGSEPICDTCHSSPLSLQLPRSLTHLLHELHRGDVAQVHRCRVQTGMTELLLDERHGDAFNGELSSARVTQPMRMHALLSSRLACKPWYECTDEARLDGMTIEGAEHNARSTQTNPPAFIEPASDQAEGSRVHANGPVAVPFTVANGQRTRGRVEITSLQSEGLGDPEASTIEDGEEGTIANAGGSAR